MEQDKIGVVISNATHTNTYQGVVFMFDPHLFSQIRALSFDVFSE